MLNSKNRKWLSKVLVSFEDLYQLPVERTTHGAQHASRVSVMIPMLINLLSECQNAH